MAQLDVLGVGEVEGLQRSPSYLQTNKKRRSKMEKVRKILYAT